MDCKVILSPRAIQDLEEIVRYISFDNPKVAEQFGYALIDAALSLSNLPERGRFVPEFGDGRTREILHGHIGSSIASTRNRKRSGFPDFGTPPEARLKPDSTENKVGAEIRIFIPQFGLYLF